ncbi:MAG: peroxidase family protein [Pyrinomonadaceae bacterium]
MPAGVGVAASAAKRFAVAEGENVRLAMVNKFLGPGKFGKMFPSAAPFIPPDAALISLGEAMREPGTAPTLDNPKIPAGFTYLGQFIDHDITFDKTEGFPQIDDPKQIQQARTPSLDLDSLYGLGPKRQPELYQEGVPQSRALFKIGATREGDSSGGQDAPPVPGGQPHDLPRKDKLAVIADPRNDENLIVAQLHLAMLKFHNKVVALLQQKGQGKGAAKGKESGTAFKRAKKLVTWHYQWIVLYDFVGRLIDPKVLDSILKRGRKFYKWDERPFMPLEFSVAAYRLGHSMVREQYNYNRVFSTDPGALTVATLGLLFRFTGKSGEDVPIPGNWVIDWRRFFDVGSPQLLNATRKLDTTLIPALHNLPKIPDPEPKSLAVRNLLRGSRVGLPSAQEVAKLMKLTPLTPQQLAGGNDGTVLKQHSFHKQTPLWYYILREAEVKGKGQRLGPLGSRIVGEVFVGLLQGSPDSFLTAEPNWKPTLPSAKPGKFTMADLLNFVGELNPIG